MVAIPKWGGAYSIIYGMYIFLIYMSVYVCICIYEQKFIMAEIIRMRMFKMLLTSV